MKRLLLSILMVVIGLSAFSQSPSRFISWQPAYPLVVGESNASGIKFSNSGIYLFDTPIDSLPQYEIGHIYEQTVRYSTMGHGFYLKADSLHSLNVTYSYELETQPMGTIDFNSLSGRFKYYPATSEYKPFVVTFKATNGTETISEEVEFNFMPQLPSEADAFITQGLLPNAGDYTIIAETSKEMYLNNQYRTTYSISVSGKDVIFDNSVQNNVWGLSGREDIYELNIYAERLIIRSALSFPETDITVYAKELIFEDYGNGVASINTTPRQDLTLADGTGRHGADAGDIHLYIKVLKANKALRLILNGAKGQNTNRNGTPGDGGNGGTICSTVDCNNYCDYNRGSGGVKYDVAPDGSTNQGPAIGYGNTGRNGSFQLMILPYAYLHPYYIAAVLRHANDAFINNCLADVYQTCKEYQKVIEECLTPVNNGNEGSANNDNVNNDNVNEGYEGDLIDIAGVKALSNNNLLDDEDENKLELQNDLLRINAMLFKLEQGLDYFGNPVGWVPMLSFEVYRDTYNQEIDRAMQTLYLYYWLNNVYQTLQNKNKASQFAADATEQAIDDDIALMNSLVLEIPVLQDEAAALTAQINEVAHRIDVLQRQLMSQAINNVKKKSLWQKIIDIAKTVISAIPVVGKVGTVIKVASGVTQAVGVVSDLFNLNIDVSDISSIFDSAGSNTIDFPKILSEAQNTLNAAKGITIQNIGTNAKQLIDSFNNLKTAADPLVESVQKAYDILSQQSAPNDKVQAEYNKLIASSSLWHSLKNQIEELSVRKTELINHMNQVFCDITTTTAVISNDILALDAFKRDVFIGNSKRDLNAMLYIERMKQDAESRLLKYNYYLRKAYEYRMLKPYGDTEFSLVSLFKRAEQMGLAVDSVITKDNYESLVSIFTNDISKMTENIKDEYTNNASEKSVPIPVEITAEQLAAINRGESVNINLFEMGIFSPEEENIRIVNLSVVEDVFEAHVEGNIGTSSYMTLNMVHSGISQFRKDGQIYWFNHMSRGTANPHTWGSRYYPKSNKIESIQPSAASQSLLYSLMNNNNDQIMLFSRPSAWSNITLSKTQHQGNIVIDKLVLNVEYDYTLRPQSYRNINIRANNGLLPYIACSEPDLGGRSDGVGHLYRSYPLGKRVTFSAIEEYGSYRFANWTDDCGNIVSSKPELTVSCTSDLVRIANYELNVPVLDVPDTIRVDCNGGEFTVQVRNTGNCDTEMDWYVSDSLSTWVHLNGVTEGLDDGSFTFQFDANESHIRRVDTLEILAPESYEIIKRILVIQTDDPDTDINALDNAIYIEPIIATDGITMDLSVRLKNTLTPVGCSFKMTLPEGFTLAKDGDGDVIYTLSNRARKMSMTMKDWGNGMYDFALTPSTSAATISDADGTIITFKMQVPTGIPYGNYKLRLTKCLIQSKVGDKTRDFELSDVVTTVTVEDYILGDVNGDRKVTPSDAIMTLYHYFNVSQSGFNTKAADVNGDGNVTPADAIEILYMYFGGGSQVGVKPIWQMREPQ